MLNSYSYVVWCNWHVANILFRLGYWSNSLSIISFSSNASIMLLHVTTFVVISRTLLTKSMMVLLFEVFRCSLFSEESVFNASLANISISWRYIETSDRDTSFCNVYMILKVFVKYAECSVPDLASFSLFTHIVFY